MHKIFCDICNNEIPNDRPSFLVTLVDNTNKTVVIKKHEICYKCSMSIISVINNKCNSMTENDILNVLDDLSFSITDYSVNEEQKVVALSDIRKLFDKVKE